MKIGARNILKGKVVRVNKGAANSEVAFELSGGIQITAVNTKQSVETVILRDGEDACAVTRAANGIIAVDREKHVNC